MDAYVFVDVAPPNSGEVGHRLWSEYRETLRSVAVWGTPDIIARIYVADAEALQKFLDRLHDRESQITQTVTYLIRSDQLRVSDAPPRGARHGFVLLNVNPTQMMNVVEATARMPLVVESAGILGPADIILSVRYNTDKQLRALVMNRIQKLGPDVVRKSQTFVGISGMVWSSPEPTLDPL